MDDIARDIGERQHEFERNEYLVDRLYPLHRVAGKQKDVMTIEVRVLWQKVGGREYWHRPYVTTVTFAELRRKPDALWNLLTRCLPFEEWKYVDWSTGEFIESFYMQNDKPLNAEDQEDREGEGLSAEEHWWEGFAYNRLPRDPWSVSGGNADRRPNEVAEMKQALRELVSEDPEEYGILYLYENYAKEHMQVAKCWFVLSAVPDGSWT